MLAHGYSTCNLDSKAQWRDALERVCLSLWFVCFPNSISQRVDIFYSYEVEFNSLSDCDNL